MTTRHHDMSLWADFARGLVEGRLEETMRRHLDDGCPLCAGRLATANRLTALARADARTTPPMDAVRMAKSLAALMPLAEPPEGARLRDLLMKRVFDSAMEPLPAGARSSGALERQLLFESADYTLHVQVEPRADSTWSVVSGRLQDRSGEPLARVPACLVAADGTASFGVTSERGEFDLGAESARDGELRFLVAADLRVAVDLRHESRRS